MRGIGGSRKVILNISQNSVITLKFAVGRCLQAVLFICCSYISSRKPAIVTHNSAAAKVFFFLNQCKKIFARTSLRPEAGFIMLK